MVHLQPATDHGQHNMRNQQEKQGNMVVNGMGNGFCRNAELLLQAPAEALRLPFDPQG